MHYYPIAYTTYVHFSGNECIICCNLIHSLIITAMSQKDPFYVAFFPQHEMETYIKSTHDKKIDREIEILQQTKELQYKRRPMTSGV